MNKTAKQIEIMAPAGNFECLMAAIQGGANSVYFGVGNLNMRSHSANNFTNEDLPEVVRICREHGVKTYLTLNIVVYQTEMEDVKKALQAAKDAGISAVIASDMAVIQMARSMGIEIHISTQMNISNFEAAKFYARFADVIVLARELTLPQIEEISRKIEEEHICGPSGELLRLELFVHGALCMSISGKCYLSLQEYGASANRGSCYQLCRRGYRVTDLETGRELDIDNKYIMSPKDLCTIEFIDKIIASGITVFKIEGRARSAEYVKIVTAAYRQAADAVVEGKYTDEMKQALKDKLSGVFNRGFWDGYYQGARLGQWSEVYGNKASRKKVYAAKVTNYFSKLGVAEILVEAGEINVGDEILIIGPSTGCIEHTIEEIRVDLKPVKKAVKGDLCSIPVAEKLRRSDKLYIWQPA
ncbi:MAG: U32 family peptidase [Bacteroidales bacterium]|nr:U32 family peptidase [Bacteroidales bacterium]